VDVLVAVSPQAARAAKEATSTIPIVMVAVDDPVGAGLVASLARPGGNITGVTWGEGPELMAGKTLQLLKQALPATARVGILWSRGSPSHPRYLREAERVAPGLGLTIRLVGVARPEEFEGAFKQMTQARVDAVVIYADPLFAPLRSRLIGLATSNRLPSMCGYRPYVEAGCLMSYGPSSPQLWRRAADFVDKILKGAKPADPPVEQPPRLELVVNLRTAKALGLNLPYAFLARADEVIE
jgi:putative ABC transport system substrate-binding protein